MHGELKNIIETIAVFTKRWKDDMNKSGNVNYIQNGPFQKKLYCEFCIRGNTRFPSRHDVKLRSCLSFKQFCSQILT